MSRCFLFFEKLKLFSHQLNSTYNGPVFFLFFKIIFRHWIRFLSVVTNGKDGFGGLKPEKAGPTFSSFDAMPAKITWKITMVSLLSYNFVSLWYLLHNSTGAFCVWVKTLSIVIFQDFHSTKQGLPLVDSWSHRLD